MSVYVLIIIFSPLSIMKLHVVVVVLALLIGKET